MKRAAQLVVIAAAVLAVPVFQFTCLAMASPTPLRFYNASMAHSRCRHTHTSTAPSPCLRIHVSTGRNRCRLTHTLTAHSPCRHTHTDEFCADRARGDEGIVSPEAVIECTSIGGTWSPQSYGRPDSLWSR